MLYSQQPQRRRSCGRQSQDGGFWVSWVLLLVLVLLFFFIFFLFCELTRYQGASRAHPEADHREVPGRSWALLPGDTETRYISVPAYYYEEQPWCAMMV